MRLFVHDEIQTPGMHPGRFFLIGHRRHPFPAIEPKESEITGQQVKKFSPLYDLEHNFAEFLLFYFQ